MLELSTKFIDCKLRPGSLKRALASCPWQDDCKAFQNTSGFQVRYRYLGKIRSCGTESALIEDLGDGDVEIRELTGETPTALTAFSL